MTDEALIFQDDIFADVAWSDDTTDTTEIKPFDAIAHSLKPQYCVLPVSKLENLFSVYSWYELGILYGIDRVEFLRNATASIQAIRDRLLDSPLTYRTLDQVSLSCPVNPLRFTHLGYRVLKDDDKNHSLHTDPRDRVVVPLRTPTESILDGRGILGRKHRKSSFLRKQSTLEGTPSDDCLSPQHLIISNSLQLRIEPINEKGCPILARLSYRNRPTYASDRTFHSIGVLRLDKKRILYSVSNEELGRVQPDIRLRLLTLLKGIGLIPNGHLKDGNLPGKGARTSFYDPAMQSHLGIVFDVPSNPTQPYTVASDNRFKPMPEKQTGYTDRTVKAKRHHSQVARFTTDSAKDEAIDTLFNRAVNAERALKKEKAIADALHQDVRTLAIAVKRF